MLRAPGGARLSRKDIDGLTELAVRAGAKGLAWCKLENGAFAGGVAKFIPADMQARLRDEFGGRAEAMPVERIVFSEKNRVGIGTFSPSDPKSQDISELTGSIDLATVGQYGSESDPRAYRFDGELNVANRGLMEFIEKEAHKMSQEIGWKRGAFPN